MEARRDMTTKTTQTNPTERFEDPDEINLYDYYLVIKRRWRLIGFIFFASTIAAAITSLLLTQIYRAETTILPIQRDSSGQIASMVGRLTDLPFVGSILPSTSGDKLVNVLESRTVRENIINHLDLMNSLFPDKWYHRIWKPSEPPTIQDGVEKLDEMTNVRKDSTGDLITISVDFQNPELAATIANHYPIELQGFLNSNALSLAKRARIFLGERYQEAKQQLARSEEALRNFQTQHKLVALDEQTEAAVKAIAELKAQIMAKEVELGVFQKFVTDSNPNVIKVKDEIKGLKKQLVAMESSEGNPEADVFPAFNEAPTLGLEYMRLKRDILINEKLFELLIQQYEMAKIEEAREDVAFQVIDRAVPPEEKTKPRIILIVMLAGVASLFTGIFLVCFMEFLANIKEPKEEGSKEV
jgi:uncharacterized protein involved in exopolysaccharide biosynthesis